MKKLARVAAMMMLAGFCSSEALAQRGVQWRGGGGWEPGAPYARNYNPQTVETLSAEVVSVDSVTPLQGMSPGVHLLVKSEKESISVHLGPSWFVENQEVKIEPGDRIELRASRVTLESTTVLIAAEVKKGDQVLALRDANGRPAWSGWRRRERTEQP